MTTSIHYNEKISVNRKKISRMDRLKNRWFFLGQSIANSLRGNKFGYF